MFKYLPLLWANLQRKRVRTTLTLASIVIAFLLFGLLQTMRTALTLHHSPRVTLADGPVAYLLAAGAGLDVAGLRSWQLPPDVLASVLDQRPRLGFKREFAAAFRTEAARVPRGRAQFLRSYGAFDLAIKLAPFRD